MSLTQMLARSMGLLDEREERSFLRSRRTLLAGGSALAAFWAAATARAGTPATPLRFLVDRLTMGLTEAELQFAEGLDPDPDAAYDAYLEYQLDYLNIPEDPALLTRLGNLPTLTMQAWELIPPFPDGQAANELLEATIVRAVFSRRQLFERMVEFWTDHFNIDINNGIDRQLKPIDDRDVIRANALGQFATLLSASAHSPAMLFYLDNSASVAANPNENYARELMELHTLSADGPYTQQDVVEVARCFTGWTLYPGRGDQGTNAWAFRYNPGTHDNGAKTVLGQSIPAGGGINDGLTVLNMLTAHASTKNFIATKLCRWFWSETPEPELVSAVAAAYGATGDIRQMIRTLFHFVRDNYDLTTPPPKYKRPYHLAISGLRATAATVNTINGIRTQLTAAGQVPFTWGPPDGFPDALDAWVGLILPRWNFGASLLAGQVAGSSVNISTFMSGATTAQQAADRIDDRLFGGYMPADEKGKILAYLQAGTLNDTRRREAVGLAIAAPSYQWY